MIHSTTILLGRTRQDRRRATRSLEVLDHHQRPCFLYLTRGQAKARAVREAFWRAQNKAPSFLPEVHTWGNYRQHLAERFGDGRAELSSIAEELLAGRLWRSLRGSMQGWADLPDSPATRAGLVRLLSDWHHSFASSEDPVPGSSPAELPLPTDDDGTAAGLVGAEILPNALRHDLWLLVSQWHASLRATSGWADRASTSRALLRILSNEQLPPALTLHLQRFSSLVVDDLLWLSPLDRALLDALIDAFQRVVPQGQVRLCVESGRLSENEAERYMQASEPGLENAGSLASVALRRGWQRRVEQGTANLQQADSEPGRDDLTDIMARDGHVDLSVERPTGAIRVRRYGSELAEVRAIARSLKATLLRGIPATDCAVAFPALDRYLPLVRDSFTAYGIPFVIEKGEALIASPPVSAARQLLALAAIGGDREAFRTLLASGWVQFHAGISNEQIEAVVGDAFAEPSNGEASPSTDSKHLRLAMQQLVDGGWHGHATMKRLYRTLIECGASDGQPRHWLRAVVAYHRRRIAAKLARSTDGKTDELVARGWQRAARQVLDLYVLQRLHDRLAELGECDDVRSLTARFKQLMSELRIEVGEALEPATDDSLLAAATEANRSALNRFHDLLDEASTGITIARSLQLEEAGKQHSVGNTLRQLYQAIEQQAADCGYHSNPAGDGVSVTGVRDLHGVDIPWLWVGGAVEGEFPRSPKPSFLLPHLANRLLESLDPAREDRALFFSLLRNADHGHYRETGFLCLSLPKTVSGKEVAPSPLLQDLLALRCTGSRSESLAEHWGQLQEDEEGCLPARLSAQELLVDPQVETVAKLLLDARLQERLALHRKLHRERSDLSGFGRWDGVLSISSEHRRQSLAWLRERLAGPGSTDTELRFSATTIEAWARCPMRFFLSRVLRAEEPQPWSPEPSPPVRGSLVHRVLERFFEQRMDEVRQGNLQRAGLEGVDETARAAVKLQLREITEQVASEMLGADPSPYLDSLLRQLTAGLDPKDPDNGSFTGPLAAFVDEEALPFLGVDPVRTEWSFEPFNPAAVAAELDGVPITSSGALDVVVSGTVDRVDEAPAGEAGLAGTRRAVYDYKAGRVSTLSSIERGLNMQPVIYAAAAGNPEEITATVTGYRELPADGSSGRTRLAGDPSALAALSSQGRVGRGFSTTSLPIDRALWAVLLRRAEWYGQLIGAGVFPTTLAGTKEAGCKHCDFRRVCRHDTLRTALTGQETDTVGSFLPRPHNARKALTVLLQAEDDATVERDAP